MKAKINLQKIKEMEKQFELDLKNAFEIGAELNKG